MCIDQTLGGLFQLEDRPGMEVLLMCSVSGTTCKSALIVYPHTF